MTPSQASAQDELVSALEEALRDIADATSAEDDAGENYRWDDREGALDYAYAKSRAALDRLAKHRGGGQ